MSIFNHFKHFSISPDQEIALRKMEAFPESPTKGFMLKGNVGIVKITILKGLIE